jgi:dTDP-4-dehydrorhamnose reductase
MKTLILGASGMLGSAVIRVLSDMHKETIFGTIGSINSKKFFTPKIAQNLLVGCNVLNYDELASIFDKVNPTLVINCISLNKSLLKKNDPLLMIPIYSQLPHQLSKLCKDTGARLIQISTDGVFSGKKGDYIETDLKDSEDMYGMTKALGEVDDTHAVTIRTSIIGHELNSKNGLVEWFLSQNEECECFSDVIFSGFPTVVLAEIIRDFIMPNKDLNGIYHVASKPISKCNLLKLIMEEYGLKIKLIPNNKTRIDRSLNADRFKLATGYIPPDWKNLIKSMHLYRQKFL